jgi:hypothetical protein
MSKSSKLIVPLLKIHTEEFKLTQARLVDGDYKPPVKHFQDLKPHKKQLSIDFSPKKGNARLANIKFGKLSHISKLTQEYAHCEVAVEHLSDICDNYCMRKDEPASSESIIVTSI